MTGPYGAPFGGGYGPSPVPLGPPTGGFRQPGGYSAPPSGPAPGVPAPPVAPPPRNYPATTCATPDPAAEGRYSEAVAAQHYVAALVTQPRPAASYELGYSNLPPERFYQFKMWLQTPEGENYRRWEDAARALLDVIEPFNARWRQGWLNAELQLLAPLRSYLEIFDQHTQQLLTYADLNPAARHAQLYGVIDSANPLPVDVLGPRLAERSGLQELLDSYEQFWREKLGVELAAGWKTSWGPADYDPFVISASLRQITDTVTERLWSPRELPELPEVPPYQPAAIGLPRSMTALQQQLCQLTGGTELPTFTLPEPFNPQSVPTPMAPARPRWGRGQFYTGRAVTTQPRSPWAEGVVLEVAHGSTVQVQRFDGSVGWFAVGDVLGIR